MSDKIIYRLVLAGMNYIIRRAERNGIRLEFTVTQTRIDSATHV